ncbi:MAG: hypothetical protein JW771_05360 [Candidatus Thermoplasmatota archaeon]|nr:hypothetical protein [Candidatus Thermoplasmatota archaeon]
MGGCDGVDVAGIGVGTSVFAGVDVVAGIVAGTVIDDCVDVTVTKSGVEVKVGTIGVDATLVTQEVKTKIEKMSIFSVFIAYASAILM